VYNAIGAVFAEMSDNSGAIRAYEEVGEAHRQTR
jgi:hypothetical protein